MVIRSPRSLWQRAMSGRPFQKRWINSQSLRKSPTMKWITRSNVKVDRVACPWVIRRFVTSQAEFLFVPEDQLLATARTEEAIPFAATRFAAVNLNHPQDRCPLQPIPQN